MILTLIAVGDEYIEKTLPCINKYLNHGWQVKVLTDKPYRFNGRVETYHYNKKIFTFFDKLLFPLSMAEKYREGVLYIDVDWMCEPSERFVTEFKGGDKFLYNNLWPHGDTFASYKTDGYFSVLMDYFYRENITNYDQLKTLVEVIYYIPYSEKLGDMIFDVEKIKPVFEYTSTIIDTGYSGIGNGEGLALSYVLDKHDIPMEKFEYL